MILIKAFLILILITCLFFIWLLAMNHLVEKNDLKELEKLNKSISGHRTKKHLEAKNQWSQD